MAAVFFLTFTIGDWLKGFLELGIESLSALISDGLIAVGVNEVLRSLLVDGIIAGCGRYPDFPVRTFSFCFWHWLFWRTADIWPVLRMSWKGL